MRLFSSACVTSDPMSKARLRKLFTAASLIFIAYVVCGAYLTKDFKERFLRWEVIDTAQNSKSSSCKNENRPREAVTLPQGIIARKSDLEMQPLWDYRLRNRDLGNTSPSKNLLAIAAGIKQKELVDRIVRQFPLSEFTLMLFHYDGIVDQWKDLPWNVGVIHVSAVNQTKWWFAKRFLHPDIVAEYDYLFLWDEDLGVENFNSKRYLAIVKQEGLEISQPALDPAKSTVNHRITARLRKSRVHRRVYSFRQRRWCLSNTPACTGWVEMMAPVFSRSAWQCAWYLIQNDLSHAWGLDMKLGYCAQGDQTKKVGIVDEEYIVHLGLPTLGGTTDNELNANKTSLSQKKISPDAKAPTMQAPPESPTIRQRVRRVSHMELGIFNNRWKRAVKDDKCWTDPFQNSAFILMCICFALVCCCTEPNAV